MAKVPVAIYHIIKNILPIFCALSQQILSVHNGAQEGNRHQINSAHTQNVLVSATH
jgi:hypothetical protein